MQKYSTGQPKTVFYFDNEKDAAQHPIVRTVTDGIGQAGKPVSFSAESYFLNGKLLMKGYFKRGKENGLWEYFYDTGIPHIRIFYKNGIPVDTTYCSFPSGKLSRLLIETDSTKRLWHGIDYYENGKKMMEADFSQDSLNNLTMSNQKEWDSSGKPLMESDTGISFTFY
jgi:antitoxin component YwqK of YwqJK toxin-antitoxin module